MTSRMSRVVIVAVTVVLAWAALAVGTQQPQQVVEIGKPSPERFVADREISVVDEVATAEARAEAAAAVADQYSVDLERNAAVLDAIVATFDLIFETAAQESPAPSPIDPAPVPDPTPSTTSTTEGEGEEPTTTTTLAATETTTAIVRLYLDVDGNAIYDTEAGDLPLRNIDVVVTSADGRQVTFGSNFDGEVVVPGVFAGGPVTIQVDTSDRDFPARFRNSTANPKQSLEATGETTTFDDIGFAPLFRNADTQRAELLAAGIDLDEEQLDHLIAISRDDVVRMAVGEDLHLELIEDEVRSRANSLLIVGIQPDDLADVRTSLVDRPIVVALDGEIDEVAGQAGSAILADALQANLVFDELETQQLRDEAAAAVPDVTVPFTPNSLIVDENEVITPVKLAAIEEMNLTRPTSIQYTALFALVGIVVVLVAGYVARFRPGFWASTRRVMLLGVLLVLVALAARTTGVVEAVIPGLSSVAGFAIPAAAFGFMVAILFDPRIGVLMAIAVGSMTGIVTLDPGFAVYALLAAIAPIPLVSGISTRSDIVRAVGFTALVSGLAAVAVSWYFHAPLEDVPVVETVARAGLTGFIASLIAAGVAVMLLAAFEQIFDITTTLRLLDVIDRNHPALQLIQEEAWGTFNHSLMVGTLADKAARSIGANNLLVRAAAYYHDIGKTENPTFFIENQFGIPNPHDHLPPEESAHIIRQHVIDGQVLAKRYGIPSEVAQGIVSHHGNGIMRYFSEKARQLYGDDHVDLEDYRHHGVKPRSREMGILMLADALEGATRAIFDREEPTPDRITSVVERVVGEKVGDGQLDECALTLGDLTRVKEAFIDALVGHYHQRIPYPNFPGTDELSGDGPAGIGAGPSSEIGSGGGQPTTGSDDGPADTPDQKAAVERNS